MCSLGSPGLSVVRWSGPVQRPHQCTVGFGQQPVAFGSLSEIAIGGGRN
jgi:hypothetical protein